MALDTREKRQAASAIGFYWAPTPTPNVATDVAWRQEAAWGYPGIAPDAPVVVTGGAVWVWVDGVSTPPGTSTQGTQDKWMWSNGVVIIPADHKRSPWPRRARGQSRYEC
jgi:hypothetical protein